MANDYLLRNQRYARGNTLSEAAAVSIEEKWVTVPAGDLNSRTSLRFENHISVIFERSGIRTEPCRTIRL